MASWTHTFGPTLFVENNFNTSLINWQYSYNQAGSQQNISGQFGTPNPFKSTRRAVHQQRPLPGRQPERHRAAHASTPRSSAASRTTRGTASNHQIEFGWRYQQEILDTLPDAPEQSILSYASNATALYNPSTGTAFGTQAVTGDNGANFFLGVADSYQQTRRPQNFNMRGKDLAALRPGQLEDPPRPHPQPRSTLGVPRTLHGHKRHDGGLGFSGQEPGPKRVHRADRSKSGYTTQGDCRSVRRRRRQIHHARHRPTCRITSFPPASTISARAWASPRTRTSATSTS